MGSYVDRMRRITRVRAKSVSVEAGGSVARLKRQRFYELHLDTDLSASQPLQRLS